MELWTHITTKEKALLPTQPIAKMAADVILELFLHLTKFVLGDNEVLSIRHLRKAKPLVATVKKTHNLLRRLGLYMKIDCKRIEIEDNEFQFSLTFYEKEQEETHETAKKITVENVMDSIGEYISLNRSYAEAEFDSDYYYLEVSDFEKSTELQDFTIDLFRDKLILKCKDDLFEINLTVNDMLFNDLKDSLIKVSSKKGLLTFY